MEANLLSEANPGQAIYYLQQLYETLHYGAEAKIAALLWLVGLNAFALGIAIITIFAILWVKN